MEPTIMANDMCISNRLAYMLDEPKRGDIIIFQASKGQGLAESGGNTEEKILYCKRIIGIGGDRLSIKSGKVYVNDELLDESEYLQGDMPTLSDMAEYLVPEGHVFVMGDMRWVSYDSRLWENPYVKETDIVGKVVWILPLSKVSNYISNRSVN